MPAKTPSHLSDRQVLLQLPVRGNKIIVMCRTGHSCTTSCWCSALGIFATNCLTCRSLRSGVHATESSSETNKSFTHLLLHAQAHLPSAMCLNTDSQQKTQCMTGNGVPSKQCGVWPDLITVSKGCSRASRGDTGQAADRRAAAG